MKKAVCLSVLFIFVLACIILSSVGFYSGGERKIVYFESKSDLALPAFLSVDTDALDFSAQKQTGRLMLLGSIPVGEIELVKAKRQTVILGGQPLGIKLLSRGVLVVGMSDVDGSCPAEQAGILENDVIISVNGEEVFSNEQIERLIEDTNGEQAEILLERDGEEKTVSLFPAYSSRDGGYKAGLWVRDSCAGIGTATFYLEDSRTFAALGHPICDADTGAVFEVSDGAVCGAEITGCKKAGDSRAGELEGVFVGDGPSGSISQNADCGIFGSLDSAVPDGEEVQVAFKQEVKKGDAEIISTVSGSEPKKYSCVIESITSDGDKNLVIRITDERLLDSTGGILQGMSGSPIVQDGKLVGAVTHVMLDESSMGYGIFAETMVNYAANECAFAESKLAA